MTEAQPAHFKRHRFPAEIIAHEVWIYDRFPLAFRDVEDLPAERGIKVSFQTVSNGRRSSVSNSPINFVSGPAVSSPTMALAPTTVNELAG